MTKEPITSSFPWQNRTSKLLGEFILILGGTVSLFLLMILTTYSPDDPSWLNDHQTTNMDSIANLGGKVGALLSGILLLFWGLSSYLIVGLILLGSLLAYRRIGEKENSDWLQIFTNVMGFLLLMFATSGIEALRIHAHEAVLPGKPGGIIGLGVAGSLHRILGFDGATIFLILVWLGGFSLFSNISWFDTSKSLGVLIERVIQKIFSLASYTKKNLVKVSAYANTSDADTKRKIATKEINQRNQERIEPTIKSKKLSKKQKSKKQNNNQDAETAPPLELLSEPGEDHPEPDENAMVNNARLIEEKLNDFGVEAKVETYFPGPVITRYEIEPATGVKGSKIISVVKDLARSLSVHSIRVLETIPGKTCMGLEIPNQNRQIVYLGEILSSPDFNQFSSPLALALGKDISGKPFVIDLASCPHLLVAGTTGSGKSVSISSMILSLLYKSTPQEVRLIMIDPKMLELSVYEDIPHLLAPVVTDMGHAQGALNWCIGEMERRYRLMATLSVRHLDGLNEKVRKETPEMLTEAFSDYGSEEVTTLPRIVVIIDELADLMMVSGKKVEQSISRLAQKARAAGIHLILATQRPSVDVITGLIKANVPSRISFQVSSRVDSRTILDQGGAEVLLGKGDMLYLPVGASEPFRIHGTFVSDSEVNSVVSHLRDNSQPEYIVDFSTVPESEIISSSGGIGDSETKNSDALYDQAVEVVLKKQRASISLVQRHLRIGYNRAARIIEEMENSGLVSAPINESGVRKILHKPPSND